MKTTGNQLSDPRILLPSKRSLWQKLLCLRNQYIVILVAFAVVPLFWLGFSVADRVEVALHKEATAAAQMSLQRDAQRLSSYAERLRREVLHIAQYPPVSGLLRCQDAGGTDPRDGSTELEWRTRLGTLFTTYASVHPEVERIRYLDVENRELVRVDINSKANQRAARNEQQKEVDREFVKITSALHDGLCSISSIDLDDGMEAREDPHKLGLRAVTPVWFHERYRGVIEVVYSAQQVLAKFELPKNGWHFLATHDGTYHYCPAGRNLGVDHVERDSTMFRDWPGLKDALGQGHDHVASVDGDTMLFVTRVAIDPDAPDHWWYLGMRWDVEELFIATKHLNEMIASVVLGVSVVAILAAVIMAAAWGRPVTRLATAAHRLADGHLGVRVPITRRDELGEMSRAFNAMAETIARNTETLQGQVDERTKKLQTQKDDLASINNALNESMQVAKAATKAKSNFLANMSHEIRTPMTAILGFAENLLEDADVSSMPRNRVDAINTIQRNCRYLLNIINDILDLSKIEAGKMTVERVQLDASKLVQEVTALMRMRSGAKGLLFDVECEHAIPKTISSDPTRLKQILINMLGNAIKFTEEGGVRLIAKLVTDGKEPLMQFDVLDTGVGMTEEQVASLFQPFTQADASTTRKFGGTGLGLTISKQLAELLGGTVTVLETLAGKGTCFRITVATGPLDDVELVNNSMALGMSDDAVRPKRQTVQAQLQKCRILLAEDGPDNQRLISHILKKAGAEVVVVDNGEIATDTAMTAKDQGCPFDAILMDMQMPVMDGYEATRILRDKDYAGPIIALTANAMASDRQKCIDAGCDDYATKPVDRIQLVKTIQNYLQKLATA